jgi:CRISPR-associated endonuclease/helicase Cas3
MFLKTLKEKQTSKLIDNLINYPIKGYKGLRWLNNKKLDKLIKEIYYDDRNYTYDKYCSKYLYYRLAYSLLVSSDYYATTEFMNGKRFDIIGNSLSIQNLKDDYNNCELMKKIRFYEKNKVNKSFKDITDINDLRCELFLESEKTLLDNLDKNIYFLEAPTGSGKSNTAINLSFHLMKDKGKIFYIYPFNTLVEQNKKTLDKLFTNDKYKRQIVVVNSLTPLPSGRTEEDSTEYYQKQLLDRQFLNYPIILSTHVSFFNLLFGSQKEDIFGFHQLCNSVIVLDEIQSYRNKLWSEIIIMLNACAKLLNIKIIIMSATLPNLEKLSNQKQIIQRLLLDSSTYFSHKLFKDRVKIHYDLLDQEVSLQLLKQHIIKQQDKDKKILVEFLTKRTAYEFYDLLKNSKKIKCDVQCITGDDSLIEREKILKPIREGQISNLILISTQVIEAGVDIDMDIGYKNISLLDSEEQFLGRINRSCKKNGEVYFFNYDNYHNIYKNDIRTNDSLVLNNIEMKKILLNKNFNQYYDKIIELLKRNFNQRSNEVGIDYFINELVYKLNYEEISKRMKLIDDSDWEINIVLCRKLKLEDGSILDGWEIWNSYKKLLLNNNIDYAKKQVKLIEIKTKLNYFIYKVNKNIDIQYNDVIGELYCVEDGNKYFKNEKLDRNQFNDNYDII